MLQTILIIAGLFLFALALRRQFTELCAICFAVLLAWIIGLAIGFDPLILGMLMGGSAVGLLYYLGKRLPERFHVFKLPYLLTALTLIFLVLKKEVEPVSFLTLAGIWILFAFLYFSRDGGAREWFRKMVECCRNW